MTTLDIAIGGREEKEKEGEKGEGEKRETLISPSSSFSTSTSRPIQTKQDKNNSNKRRRGLGSNPLAPPIRATDELVLLGGGENGAGGTSSRGSMGISSRVEDGSDALPAPPLALLLRLLQQGHLFGPARAVRRVRRRLSGGQGLPRRGGGRRGAEGRLRLPPPPPPPRATTRASSASPPARRSSRTDRATPTASSTTCRSLSIDPRWGADEEGLLLEGISMFGLGSWGAVADHVNAGGRWRWTGAVEAAGREVEGGGAANNCSNDAAIAAALAAGTTPAFLDHFEQQQTAAKEPGLQGRSGLREALLRGLPRVARLPRPAPLPSMSAAAKAGGGGGACCCSASSCAAPRASLRTRDKEGDMDMEGEDPASAEREKAKEDPASAVKR